MPLIPSVKSLGDSSLSFKKDKFTLPKGLASLRSSSLPNAQVAQPEAKTSIDKDDSSDITKADGQTSSESNGVVSRSQIQLEQFAKRWA